MINNKIYQYLFLFLISILIYGCEEPIDLEIENPESILVVEATITDELKNQVINLSRTYPVKKDSITSIPPETNAEVKILDSANNEYFFEETEPGIYVSVKKFQAKPNSTYQLKITTSSGTSFTSNKVHLAIGTEIDELYGTRTTYNGQDGVALLIDNENTNSNATNFFRFQYKETFKIVSPYQNQTDFYLINNTSLALRPKTKEEHVCYRTQASTEIMLANTKRLTENNLEKYLLRFIGSESAVLSFRYTILVKQYALSREAYNFYHTLKEFSESGGIFTQVQPGFITGNIFPKKNSNKKVIGIFNASSVSSKRIYISHSDFYGPNEEEPVFAKNCEISTPLLYDELIPMVRAGTVKFYGTAPPNPEGEIRPYYVVPTPCMDCTVFGSNVKPDFWIDEKK